MLTPSQGMGVAALRAFPYCYDACPLVSMHGPRMTCPDLAVRFRDADRRRLPGSGIEAKLGYYSIGAGTLTSLH